MLVLGLHRKDGKSSKDKANISNPKVNRGCPSLTANRTSADCVQIWLGPSIQYISLRVCHTGDFNAMQSSFINLDNLLRDVLDQGDVPNRFTFCCDIATISKNINKDITETSFMIIHPFPIANMLRDMNLIIFWTVKYIFHRSSAKPARDTDFITTVPSDSHHIRMTKPSSRTMLTNNKDIFSSSFSPVTSFEISDRISGNLLMAWLIGR